jgi:DNA-binding transcriptional MerR regulator
VTNLHKCPDCLNTFTQPFRCTTCGAQRLYDETVRTQAETIAALRAEREKSLADARESDRLLKVAEQTIAAQDERVAALRARIAELEAAGRAVLACTDKVCGLPGKCFKHCEADAMLRAVLPTGTRHE